MNKKAVSKVKGKTVTLKADRRLFARLMLIGKARNINIRQMLTFCLGPLPLPFSTEQGTLVKTNKATLLHHLESAVETSATVESIPMGSIWLIDGMAMLQQLHSPTAPITFYDLAQNILHKLINLAIHHQSPAIHFVTDTYPRISIKNAERGRRAATGAEIIKIQQNSTTQKRPTKWKKFLSAGEYKEAFVNFLFCAWKKSPANLFRNVTVYLVHGEECHAITATNGSVTAELIPDLACSHEEADSRLILHAQFVQNNMVSTHRSAPGVIIKSMDTDVFILSLGLAHQNVSVPFLFHTGRGDQVRTIDINTLQHQLGSDVTSALLGLHPFTGCDSVSGFFGKGKIKAYKLMKQNDQYITSFKDLGATFTPTEDLLTRLEHFVCHLYGQQKAASVNDARYTMFRLGTHAEESLPPNKDALRKHVKRANFQAAIFRRSVEQFPHVPSPDGNGWKLEDNEGQSVLQIDWCDQPPAPDEILELMYCNCKRSKCTASKTKEVGTGTRPKCCSEMGLRCTELCVCTGCTNRIDDNNSDTDEDGDDDSDSEDES